MSGEKHRRVRPETAPVSAPLVVRSATEGIVTLTMNRAERMNPLSIEMLDALQAELDRLAVDDAARVVVLAGAGPHFCAGHDLREMRRHPAGAWQAALFERCGRMMMALVALPQPVIARVQGAAVAAGCELVSMCDLAIAAETASFALPGIKSGIFCTTPGVPVARNLSRKHALEMLLTGRMIDPATALAWGLVNRVVPVERLDDEVDLLARTIASYSPAVVRLGKKAFYEQVEQDLRGAYAVAGAAMADNMMLEDAIEGIDAFLAKLQPNWRGR
jgi:enoyl-CoA hydratase/carnithine racemase